jgi:hypothetical protein
MSARLSIAVAISCLVAAAPADAQVRPNGSWRQFESNNFTIIYEAGLDSIARRAATRAELEHARLTSELTRAPRGRIDIVIADNMDITNGNARPFPGNRVTIWVRPPVEELSLQGYDDWIDLVIAHELTHIFHLDRTGKFGHAVRAVLGRVPFPWPVFPLVGVPRWNTEGLATVVESQHTNSGRVRGSYHEMVVRTDILENAFPTIDRISGESPLWPGGSRAYIYGSLFLDYIERRYGPEAHRDVVAVSAGSLLPPPWRMDAIAKKAIGRDLEGKPAGYSFSDLYDQWRKDLEATYRTLADSLEAQGITQSERITTAGRWALHPRISPDNTKLAYSDENGRDVTATRILDLATGEDIRIRRNGIGRVAWLPDNRSVVTDQLEFTDRYSIQSDLYIERDGNTERLTNGARAESPDVSPDGKRIVYVQNAGGTNRLVVREIVSGREFVLIEASPRFHWILPRWSPDGSRIAVQHWVAGGYGETAIAFIDVPGTLGVGFKTEGRNDTAPAWSPDGKHVLFASDRTGIMNLYAYDVGTGMVQQVTNVLGGAFYPEVSPDGKWIYFSGYHADGFHIERIPYDPSTWRVVMPAAPPDVRRTNMFTRTPDTQAVPALSAPRAYSPVRSLLPKYWAPLLQFDDVTGDFIGANTWGEDAIERHSYLASLAYDVTHGRVMGDVEYAYAGLGNPVLSFAASRLWDNTGLVTIRNTSGEVTDTATSYDREDRIAVSASLVNRRWRSSNALALGVEGVEINRRINHTAQFTDPRDRMLGVLASASFGSYRVPALAISREDGVRGFAAVRQRYEIDPLPDRDKSYRELSAEGAGYKSLGGNGFAHNVVAARASGVHRNKLGGGPTDIGGVDGFLPVRGYKDDARVGFRAWTASLEYRMPLRLIARGYRLRPLFIDRVSTAFFVDAGNASCTAEQRAVYLSCAGNPDRSDDVLVGAGFEVHANVAVLSFAPTWARLGIGFPVGGESRTAQVYLTLAPAF